jgi:hypothetical protein
VRVMVVAGETFDPHILGHRFEHTQDGCRRADAYGVAERDLVTAVLLQSRGYLGDALRLDRTVIGDRRLRKRQT